MFLHHCTLSSRGEHRCALSKKFGTLVDTPSKQIILFGAMGRAKTKKKIKAAEPTGEDLFTPLEDLALRAMDRAECRRLGGEEDIRTYNELLMERAKLEKERTRAREENL